MRFIKNQHLNLELILLGDTNCDFGNKEKDHLTDNNANSCQIYITSMV